MVLKRIITILTLFVYLAVSSGFVLSTHYCMDRLDSIELGSSESDKCGECGMQKKEGCCHDDVAIIKLTTAHFSSAPSIPDFGLAILPPHFGEVANDLVQTMAPDVSPSANAPPNRCIPIYLENRVFRI